MGKDISCPECGCEISSDNYSADPARRRYFAIIRESWANLREPYAGMFSSPEALRKHLLIKTGWCDTLQVVVGNKTAAANVVAAFRNLDRYVVATAEGSVVTVYKARSQTRRAQPKALFMVTAEAVYNELAAMLGANIDDVQRVA